MVNTVKSKCIKLELMLLLWMVIFALFGLLLFAIWPDKVFSHVTLHTLVETVGGLFPIILAFLLLSKGEGNAYTWVNIPVATGLLFTGIISIFHAVALPGDVFVFLYTMANLAGGICFALVYLSENKFVTQHIRSKHIIWLMGVVSCLVLIWVFLYANTLPVMVRQGEFTPIAQRLNFLAGIFYLAAAGWLLFLFHKRQEMELYFLSCVAAFKGLAGLMFLFSGLWTVTWWYWHGLHIVSYLFMLGFLVYDRQQLFRNLQRTIAELKKNEAELKSTHQQLLHAEKLSALGKLTASIAHEFNNPIYGIKMVLEGLEEDANLNEEDRKQTRLAVKETNRLSRMIQNLQDFYLPSEGMIAPLDIHQAINDVLEICGKKLVISGIRVEKDFADDIPLIPVVADQIKQVFLNIISNAEEAMLQSGGCLTIQTRELKNKVRIIFKDEGIGIPKENLDKIFDPFFTTKSVKGTGLGLSVSYGIIRKHGGDIWAESIPHKGSIFTIELPYAAEKGSFTQISDRKVGIGYYTKSLSK